MLKQIISLGAASALALTLSANSWAQQTWTVNFKDSDIQEVIKFVADVTGRTVVIDPRVKGRVKVISNKPLDEEQLLQLFRTVLEIHDFSMVEVDELIRIIPLKDARSAPVPVAEPNTNKKGFVTQVIQLQNIAAAKVLPSIRPLVPQHSHLSAYDPSNAIIITDSAENIERIRDLIERLDQSATPVTEIIELKYANAADLTQVLDSIEKEDSKRSSRQNTLNLTADKRNNAILVTGEDLQRERVKSLIKRLDRPRAQSGNVRVVYLEYADAKTVAETLSKVMTNLSKLGPGGGKAEAGAVAATVEADEDTNALLITAAGDDLESLLDVVARLDIRRAQVLVEAIIVEMTDSDGTDLGIDWMFTNTENGTFGRTAGTAISGIAAGALAEESGDSEPGAALGAALAQATGQILGVAGINNSDRFVALLTALQSDTKTNILSTPSLLTMDNHEASFSVGQNIPLRTGSSNVSNGLSNPFTTIQREDVGIKMTVTPQINEGDSVLLEIEQEVSSVSQEAVAGAADIVTNQKSFNTKVLAASGEIIVLGGLVQNADSRQETRVPLLGSIPILGRLFRTESVQDRKTNLMVFLKATVIRNDEYLNGLTAEKYHAIRNEQINHRSNGFGRLPDSNTTVLPEMSLHNLSLPDDDVVVTPGARKTESGVAPSRQPSAPKDQAQE